MRCTPAALHERQPCSLSCVLVQPIVRSVSPSSFSNCLSKRIDSRLVTPAQRSKQRFVDSVCCCVTWVRLHFPIGVWSTLVRHNPSPLHSGARLFHVPQRAQSAGSIFNCLLFVELRVTLKDWHFSFWVRR